MVNTFLTSPDFSQSAASLDSARLGKQRVEAYQIICLVQDLTFLSEFLQSPIPTNPNNLREWIRRIVREYKARTYRFVVRRCPKVRLYIMVHERDISRVTLQANDRVMNLGFVYHPAVQMWLKYEDALKDYINCHIQEWVSRGYNNTMSTYLVPPTYQRPPWCDNPSLHQNHRGSLLKKEMSRNEKPWYRNKPEFVAAPRFIDYIWPLG